MGEKKEPPPRMHCTGANQCPVAVTECWHHDHGSHPHEPLGTCALPCRRVPGATCVPVAQVKK